MNVALLTQEELKALEVEIQQRRSALADVIVGEIETRIKQLNAMGFNYVADRNPPAKNGSR